MKLRDSDKSGDLKRREEAESLVSEAIRLSPDLTTEFMQIVDRMTPNRTVQLIPIPLDAFERYTKELFTPETRSWMRLSEVIDAAQVDPAISSNPEAVEFLSMMKTLAAPAWGHWKLSHVLQPLVDHVKSENARIAASQKNEAPRLWVLSKWESRTDQGQAKAAFARQYAPLVKKEFGLIVTPETIARDWLPRARK